MSTVPFLFLNLYLFSDLKLGTHLGGSIGTFFGFEYKSTTLGNLNKLVESMHEGVIHGITVTINRHKEDI